MSILIKGMAMPKNCEECAFNYDMYRCMITLKSTMLADAERLSDCPLIELPPHGRLIDADAFRTANGLGEDCENCHRNTRTCNYDVCLSRMDVCGWVDDAPTIIEAEEEDEKEM